MKTYPYPHILPNGHLTFDNKDWSNIWLATKSSSPNSNAIETNYKVLTRWYLVPARIAKFIPTYPPNCFRGCDSLGTHFHIWWQCPIVQDSGKIYFPWLLKLLKSLFFLILLQHF